MSIEQRIDRLEGRIHRLQVDFERFFNGDLAAPPESLRTEILADLRGLRSVNLQTPVDTFRLAQLEARFASYSELFNRRVREREEGRERLRAASEPRGPDPAAGVVVGGRLSTEAVEALYRGLVAGPGGARFDIASFRAYLERQLATIRARTGCAEVQFRLISDDGKTRLKAKPLGGVAAPAVGRTT
jgi:hypothetical protein